MKRIILTLSLLVLTVSAGAWNKSSYAAIMTLASQQLSPEVKSNVQKALGGELATASLSEMAALTFAVDENFVPLRRGSERGGRLFPAFVVADGLFGLGR